MLSLSTVIYIFSGSLILSYHIATAVVPTVTSPAYSNFTFNCLEAEKRDNDLEFCHMVHWTSSSAFNSSPFSAYYPGEKLSVEMQDQRAHDFYDSMYTKNGDSDCRQAVKRLACTMFFPECPEVSTSTSGIQSFPLCHLQCQQAEDFCGEHFDCSSFPTENCMMFLPTGYFLLDPHQGPYDALPAVYSVCLASWVIIALLWHLGAFYLYKDSSVIICKAVGTLPLVKVVVLVIGTAFWTTCDDWSMCSFWLGVSLINTHLVYETGLMVCFLLIAKGWSITRDNFSANEWRGIIISMSAFYMSNSIILVLEASVLSKQGFWVACTLLYGIMYMYIAHSAGTQLWTLREQVHLLHAAGEVPDAIGGPLHTKYHMYLGFLFLVLCNVVLEITLHALLNNYGKMWIVLTVYEICDLVICGLIFFIFRPRDHSPFFFMVPATLNDTRTRPIPIIEAIDDDSELAEIEIAPLLGAQRNPNNNNSNDKMVIIRNPGGDVMVGMSPVMQTRSHHGGSGARDPQRGRGYVSNNARGSVEMQRQGSSGESFENRLLRGIDSLPPRNNINSPPRSGGGGVAVSPSLDSRGQEFPPNFGHDDNSGHGYGGANGNNMMERQPPPSSSTVQMTSYY